MKLTKVQRILTRRLAWLTAKAAAFPADRGMADERDALHTLLRCQGLLDDGDVAHHVAACEARVLPAEERTKARARRGDQLVDHVLRLVDELQRVRGAA